MLFYYLHSFLKHIFLFIPNLKSDELSILISILIGLVTAVLTLVGLVSIFISINSQHKVEKSREAIWSIQENNFNIREIVKHLNIYNELQSNNEKYTNSIINLVTISITLVCLVIFLCVIAIINTVSDFVFGISFVSAITIILLMGGFAFKLKELKNIKLISNLQPIDELLDCNNKESDILPIDFIYNMTMVMIGKKTDEWKLYIGFPIPITNLNLKYKVYSIKYEEFIEGELEINYKNSVEFEREHKCYETFVRYDDIYWFYADIIQDKFLDDDLSIILDYKCDTGEVSADGLFTFIEMTSLFEKKYTLTKKIINSYTKCNSLTPYKYYKKIHKI